MSVFMPAPSEKCHSEARWTLKASETSLVSLGLCSWMVGMLIFERHVLTERTLCKNKGSFITTDGTRLSIHVPFKMNAGNCVSVFSSLWRNVSTWKEGYLSGEAQSLSKGSSVLPRDHSLSVRIFLQMRLFLSRTPLEELSSVHSSHQNDNHRDVPFPMLHPNANKTMLLIFPWFFSDNGRTLLITVQIELKRETLVISQSELRINIQTATICSVCQSHISSEKKNTDISYIMQQYSLL